jgi:hypothetical protein
MKWVWAALAGSILGAASPAAAQSLLDSLGRSSGLVAPDPDMPDFVKASRPKATPTPMSVFAPPPEPKSKVKSPAELKAMDADLARAARGAEPTAPLRKAKQHKS